MTTRAAAEQYLAQHKMEMYGRPFAVFNPQNLAMEELPRIYGFNNGGRPGWFNGVIIAEDGAALGSHVCSNEGYMYHDLGILEGTRPDRHETFQAHYPNGYRMEFIKYDDVSEHVGLQAAFKRSNDTPTPEEQKT